MRFASMRALDISNGENVGVSLFVQGCPFHCYNCFNHETWNFDGGKEWTEETKNKFMELIDRPYIKRISILGGEPLAEQNLDGVLNLIKEIRKKYPISKNTDCENPYKSSVSENDNSDEIRISYPEKSIWLYSGYTWEHIMDCIAYDEQGAFFFTEDSKLRYKILTNVDIFVDGEYIDEQRDITLAYRGSKNQRVIDVQQSLKQNKIVLYCD